MTLFNTASSSNVYDNMKVPLYGISTVKTPSLHPMTTVPNSVPSDSNQTHSPSHYLHTGATLLSRDTINTIPNKQQGKASTGT
jgi:hypothetical protein